MNNEKTIIELSALSTLLVDKSKPCIGANWNIINIVFNVDLLEAIDNAVKVLENADKYKWHDLKADKYNLPSHNETVLCWYRGEPFTAVYDEYAEIWYETMENRVLFPSAWRHIEPFEI